MPVPNTINDLSTTAASNSPGGAENPFPELDDHLRKGYSFMAILRDLVATKLSASSVSAFIQTLFDDTDAATARNTLGAVGKTGDETVAGVKTFAAQPVLPGNALGALEAVPKQQLDSFSGRNRVINGTFSVNQRAFAGGALTAGTYGHDRWKAGAGGATYTVTGEVATITAGTLQQVIEGVNAPEGGTYTLSWSGTAQARVDGGAYAASPITVTGRTAGANTTVEFGTGTVSRVQYEAGSAATTFERLHFGTQLLLCQRYYLIGRYYGWGYAPNAGTVRTGSASFPATMRATPTIDISGGVNSNIVNLIVQNASATNFGLYGDVGGAALHYVDGPYRATAEL